MGNSNVKKLILAALCVAINVVLGSFVGWLSIPLLFLDTLGTIFIAAYIGTGYGILVGVATNLLMGVTSGVTAIPFALVNVMVALVVGLMAKKGFTLGKAITTGLILSIVAPLIGTPIRLALFGGFTGSGTDIMIMALLATGEGLFTSTFLSAIAGNLVDKIVSCLLVWYLVNNKAIKNLKKSINKS